MSNEYFYGTLLSFSKSYCEGVVSKSKVAFHKVLNRVNASERDSFLVMSPQNKELHPLVHNYSILFSLGMIESDGAFNEGRDISAWNIGEVSAEAGLYQSSYDTHRNDKNAITSLGWRIQNQESA